MIVNTKPYNRTSRTKTKKPLGRKINSGFTRRKICRFCVDKVKVIDYKDTKKLESFISERGKIVSARFSGNCAKHQRLLAEAIKKARFISLVPYLRQ